MPRILLVDDDTDVRETLQELLQEEGFDVRMAANGAEALGVLEDLQCAPPDVILLDIMMPVMDGPQFLESYAARPELPVVPVVVMSALQVRDRVARNERVVVQLHKPVDVDRLVAVLGHWCSADTTPLSPAPDTVRNGAGVLGSGAEMVGEERSFAWLPVDPHRHGPCARRVLIVEDDEDVRESVAEVLRDGGYEVTSARNGAEAITLLRGAAAVRGAHRPDDAGDDRLGAGRSHTRQGVPVHPAVGGDQRRRRAPAPGVDRVLPKPIELDALLAAVGQFCSASDSRDRDAALRELTRRNIELVELQRFREEMSALIVHDMKSPLMAITGNLHYVLGGPLSEDEDSKREALQETREAADHLTRLIENLLHLVKLESGRFLPRRSEATLRSIVAPLARRRQLLAQDHRLTLDAPELPDAPLLVDVDLVTRALDNLLDNAFRYTPCGGHVRIDAEVSPGSVRIHVGNTGTPVPLDARHRIFDKFGQVANGNGKVNVGLGLYFCRLVAEAHGGTIRVEQTPELSTVFTLELPRAAAGAEGTLS
ncbi:MAG: response regulator [Polyangiaceae bacterium]